MNPITIEMRARRKQRIRNILKERDFKALDKWAKETRAPLRILFSLTYDSNPLICYRAIEAIGRVAAFIAPHDTEKVRTFIRSLIWLMTEESGGIGWHAPEAIAEICIRVPVLFEEYANLLPQFLEERSFVPSTLAALSSLAHQSPDLVSCDIPFLTVLFDDDEIYQTYDSATGFLNETTVGQLARQVFTFTCKDF